MPAIGQLLGSRTWLKRPVRGNYGDVTSPYYMVSKAITIARMGIQLAGAWGWREGDTGNSRDVAYNCLDRA